MHMLKRAVLSSAVAAVSVLSFTSTALAANWGSSAQYASWSDADYSIYNDVWGQGAGPQSIWANSGHNWGVWSEQPNTGGIKSYPDSSRYVGLPVNDLASVSSDFNVTVPTSGAQFETAYDIWAGDNQYEIMLWMNNYGNGPIASSYNCNGACPSFTNVSVGGYTWNVYSGYTDHTVYSFVSTSQVYSGTVDVLSVLHWLQSQGWIGNPTLDAVQFGWEITSSATGENWACNSYDVSYSSNAVRFKNAATGMFIDGMGNDANGSNLDQWSDSGSTNQQWRVFTNGDYVQMYNVTTGLYIDGMGRTTNGSAAGQWSYSGSSNQQWIAVGGNSSNGNIYSQLKYRNSATGLYLDGLGSTTNGSITGQWSAGTSNNQRWYAVGP